MFQGLKIPLSKVKQLQFITFQKHLFTSPFNAKKNILIRQKSYICFACNILEAM